MLYLASQSPRRIELIQALGVPFEIVVADFEETKSIDDAHERVKHNAIGKAIHTNVQEGTVLGIDTIVVHAGKIFEKPKDTEEAFQMLRELSGTEHEVVTAACFYDAKEKTSDVQMYITKLWLYDLSDEDIRKYLATGEALDKAGAYSIQGSSRIFIKKIEGDYYGVMGVPVEVMRRVIANG